MFIITKNVTEFLFIILSCFTVVKRLGFTCAVIDFKQICINAVPTVVAVKGFRMSNYDWTEKSVKLQKLIQL